MDGNLLLHLSLISFSIAFLSIIFHSGLRKHNLLSFGVCIAFVGCALIVMSFMSLMHAYVISDMSLINVAMNSSTLMPLHYKIAAVWGNHEGSMLLLSMYFSIASTVFYRLNYRQLFAKKALLVQLSLNIFLIIFIIKTSNPFVRVYPVPHGGLGLNPVLQDSGLVLHPPILYLGHAGCFIIYSIFISFCNNSNFSNGWLLFVRPWILFSLAFLTLGIGLGSWWAYKEIGWGGFWFWDPVENISIFPWLVLCALLHCLVVRGDKFYNMTFFLGIFGFICVLFGIFIVRAGLLRSVHSFANDPGRGQFLLAIFLAYSGYAFWEFGGCIRNVKGPQNRRERLISINCFVFLTCLLIVFVGTFYPFLHEIFLDRSIVFSEDFFNITFISIILIGLIFCMKLLRKSYISLVFTLLIILFLFQYFPARNTGVFVYTNFLSLTGIFCGVYVVLGSILSMLKGRAKIFSTFGHAIFGLSVLSISFCSLFSFEDQFVLDIGESKSFLNFEITLRDVMHKNTSNYLTKTAVIKVKSSFIDEEMTPELRIFPIEKQMTSEPAIMRNILYDLHININQITENSFLFSFYYRPMINFLWTSILLAFLLFITKAVQNFKHMHF